MSDTERRATVSCPCGYVWSGPVPEAEGVRDNHVRAHLGFPGIATVAPVSPSGPEWGTPDKVSDDTWRVYAKCDCWVETWTPYESGDAICAEGFLCRAHKFADLDGGLSLLHRAQKGNPS